MIEERSFTLLSTINPPVLMRGISGVVKDGLDKNTLIKFNSVFETFKKRRII